MHVGLKTIQNVKEVRNVLRTGPLVLKADAEATVETCIASKTNLDTLKLKKQDRPRHTEMYKG